jgi:hypothetical protein
MVHAGNPPELPANQGCVQVSACIWWCIQVGVIIV